MVESIAPRPAIAPVVPAIESVCPYLLADDGAWRASTPAREHRCTAVTPPAQLAADKQRRLCLTAEHRSCATFQVATGRGPHGTIAEPVRADRVERASGRTVVRTAPLVLDHGRLAVTMPMLPADRSIGQYALVALMGVALAAILVARLSTPATADPDRGGGAGAGAVVATSAPTGTPDPAASEDVPTRTLVPTEVDPSPGAEPAASAPVEPAATPAPAEAPRTYKVKRGDTLSGIAAEFGTTVKKLKALNDISDPSLLRIGQVLELP